MSKEAIKKVKKLPICAEYQYLVEEVVALLRADQATAGSAQTREPETGEFTKEARSCLHNLASGATLIGKKRYNVWIREACAKLDRQVAEIKKLQVANEDLYGELDAECRVSQMLLAELKKFKDKQDAE